MDEAHALWKFETYICVRSNDAPSIYFRRAVATWQIEVNFDSKSQASATVTPNPVQIVSDVWTIRANARRFRVQGSITG